MALTSTPINPSFSGRTAGESRIVQAFAALRADGSVVTWGDSTYGGDSSSVTNALNGSIAVVEIFSTRYAFAALRTDGSVVTWGGATKGGDSSAVAAALDGSNDIIEIYSTEEAFAALRADGSVVTWGDSTQGGNSSTVASTLNGNTDVIGIFSSRGAFAALRADNSVVTWGSATYGGDSRTVAYELKDGSAIADIFSTGYAFAALRADGSVVTWGYGSRGGDSSSVASALNGNTDVIKIFSTNEAFAALRADGSVVTWGNTSKGGNSSTVADALNGSIDVIDIVSTFDAFAALRADGSVVTWGYPSTGGDSSTVINLLNGSNDVVKLFATGGAFAALRADGSVVTWGSSARGGDSSAVASALNGNTDVIKIFSTWGAFAALRADGSVVTWGGLGYGDDSRAVANQLNGDIDVIEIFATDYAFAALRVDGSVVTWGHNSFGGNSSAVANQLDGTIDVVSMANSLANDEYRADASVTWVGTSGNTYSLYKTAKTWAEAQKIAQSVGGYLAQVQDEAENTEIYTKVMANIGASEFAGSTANDGGGASYVWLGASDAVTEGSWQWSNDGSTLSTTRPEWGSGAMGSEPDNYLNQDYLALGLTNWPAGASTGAGFGNAGEWNDLAGTNRLFFVVEKNTQPTDTIAPTVTAVIPADEASNIAVNSNIVLNFSEAISRGTGNIVLKTAAGATVAIYDAATSSNLSISGSTLTINPTADLTAGTAYKVEFAAGSIKDLAGNNFAGTTSYNFTTASSATPAPSEQTLTKDAQFVVLQPGSPAIVGAGTGDDTYLLSGSMLSAGKSITISDAIGNNSIQLAPGLSITTSQVTGNALKLNLSNGAAVTVLGADKFTYDVGGNTSAGRDNSDISYQSFVAGTLGTSIPASGVATGSNQVIDSVTPASLLASTTTGDDFVALQYASPAVIGAGAGNDTYLIANDLLPAGTTLTISDAIGANSIQLAPGLTITSSQVASTALKLTLASGATVTILGANNFTYDVGANTTAGINKPDVNFATFVQGTLGTTVPTSGVMNGGNVVIGGTAANTVTVQGNTTVNATANSEVFFFDAVTALLDTAGTNTQATISGFATSADTLRIDLPSANAAITNLSQLNGQQGVVVQTETINPRTLINFGNDANGGQAVSLILTGITDPALVSVQVV